MSGNGDMSGHFKIYPNDVIDGSHDALKHEALGLTEFGELKEKVIGTTRPIDFFGYDSLREDIVSGSFSVLEKQYGISTENYSNKGSLVKFVENMISGLESELGTLCPETVSVYTNIIASTLEENAKILGLLK